VQRPIISRIPRKLNVASPEKLGHDRGAGALHAADDNGGGAIEGGRRFIHDPWYQFQIA
jgi:hypothetical protein